MAECWKKAGSLSSCYQCCQSRNGGVDKLLELLWYSVMKPLVDCGAARDLLNYLCDWTGPKNTHNKDNSTIQHHITFTVLLIGISLLTFTYGHIKKFKITFFSLVSGPGGVTLLLPE